MDSDEDIVMQGMRNEEILRRLKERAARIVQLESEVAFFRDYLKLKQDQLDQTERWFANRGVHHAIKTGGGA